MNFFDAHTHVSTISPKILNISLVSTDENCWERLLLEQSFPNKIIFLGIHPWYVEDAVLGWENRLEDFLINNSNVGVGECGLDKKNGIDFSKQRQLFEIQVKLACKYNRLLSIHSVHADGSVLEILERIRSKGVIHSFSGSLESAYHYIKVGFKISFSPTIIYKNRKKIRAVIKALPIESMVIETDFTNCIGGNKKTASNTMVDLLQEIATIRGENFDDIANIIYKNSIDFFLK